MAVAVTQPAPAAEDATAMAAAATALKIGRPETRRPPGPSRPWAAVAVVPAAASVVSVMVVPTVAVATSGAVLAMLATVGR